MYREVSLDFIGLVEEPTHEHNGSHNIKCSLLLEYGGVRVIQDGTVLVQCLEPDLTLAWGPGRVWRRVRGRVRTPIGRLRWTWSLVSSVVLRLELYLVPAERDGGAAGMIRYVAR